MESIGSILKTAMGAVNKNTTLTKTSNQSSYDSDNGAAGLYRDIAAAVKKSELSDFSKSVEVCGKCGQPLQADIELLGVLRRMPIICKCRTEELRCKKEHDKVQILQGRLNKFKAYSLMDERFEESTFKNWKLREDNRSLYEFGKRYCDNWETVKNNNRGLLIYGKAGSGKTYLSFAIANELYASGKAVLAISASRILKTIMDSYRMHGTVGEMDILNTFSEVSLLIIDDLGVENKTYWSYEKIYSLIDTRYRAKKPIIITTNLTTEGLRDNLSIIDAKTGKYDSAERIYNRITEMCAPIEVKGESWRIQKGMENRKALFKELGLT